MKVYTANKITTHRTPHVELLGVFSSFSKALKHSKAEARKYIDGVTLSAAHDIRAWHGKSPLKFSSDDVSYRFEIDKETVS